MRYRLGARLVLVALAAAPLSAAEPIERGALRLDWSAPGGCPNRVEIVERIEALLGVPVAALEPEPIVARGTVRRLEALRFELELETHQRAQRFVRSMQAPSCAELSDAGALVLALAIDPTLAERQARGETAPGTSALAGAAPSPPEAAQKAEAPKPPVRTLDTTDPEDEPPPPLPPPPPPPPWSARAGVTVDVGTVSDVSLGPRGSVEFGFETTRFELGILWLPPARTFVASETERGGYIDLIAAQAAACLLPFRGEVEMEGCFGLEVGRLHGAGFGVATETEGSALWLAGGLAVAARIRATDGLSVVASAGLLYSPQSTEFTLENVGLVHEVPPMVGRFGLAIETEFE
ncbi:MAG TPA: hypothetical protein VFZ53_32295 [Polyangiaceae bacterium]